MAGDDDSSEAFRRIGEEEEKEEHFSKGKGMRKVRGKKAPPTPFPFRRLLPPN